MISSPVKLYLALGLAAAATACAGPGAVPQMPEQLVVAAPDQGTFDALLAPEPPAGEDERSEARAQREHRIADLQALYEASKSAIVRAGALYELAKLQQERAFDLRDQAEAAYKEEVDRFAIGELAAEPSLKLDQYKDALLQRVNLLRDMASTFPRDPRLGDVILQLATTMARLGNDHCENYFKQAALQAKTPEMVNRVKLGLADWRAAAGKTDEAIKLYNDVRDALKDGNDPLKSYAAFRLGWAYLGKLDKKKAEAALTLAFLSVKDEEPTRFKIRAEAAHKLAELWAEAGSEPAARAFAEAHDLPAFMEEYRERLAAAWQRQGQYAKAIAYWRAQIAKNPTDRRVADLRLRIAHAQVALGNLAGMQDEVSALAKMANDPANPWFEEHREDADLVARTKKLVTYLPMASGFKVFAAGLAEQDAKKKQALMIAAVKILQEQQKTVRDREQALALRLSLIQGLSFLERFPETLDQLDALVKLGSQAEPHLVEAAYRRLEILVKLDGEQKYPPLPAPGDVKTPIPLPPLKQRLAAATEDYLALVPLADNKVNLRFQIAQDLFAYGHYAQALPLFEALAVEFPHSDQGKAGIEYCLSMNLKQSNFPEMIRLSTSFLNNREVKGKALREYIKQNLDWAKQQTGVGTDATAH